MYRFFAFALALLMLLSPLTALGEGVSLSSAARLTVTVSSITPLGETAIYGPAMPLSDSAFEDRLWLKVPPEVFFTGRMAILIEDKLGQLLTFEPANGTMLENITDAGVSFDVPSVSIFAYDANGLPAASCFLYISSQDAPWMETYTGLPVQEEPTEMPVELPTVEMPTEAPPELPVVEEFPELPAAEPTEMPIEFPSIEEPIAAPTEAPVELPALPATVTVRYLNEAGESIAEDTVASVLPGINNVYPEAEISDEYELTELGVKEVFVDADGANPPVVEFHYTLKAISASVKINYVDVNGNTVMESTFYTIDGGEHPVFPLPVEGYAVTEPSVQTVYVDRNGANPPEITFVYEREVQPADVTIHYVDQNGEAIRNDDVLSFGKGVHSALAVAIPGYTVAGEAEQSVQVDENGAQPQEITFVYLREIHPVDVPVHYVDENGVPIADDTSWTVSSTDNVITPAGGVNPEDYELISREAVEVMLDGDGAHPAEVTFQYRHIIKPASIVLHYVDDLGNPIAEDSVVSVPAGESAVTPAQEVDASLYALMEPVSYPVTVTAEGASPNEFTFMYQRLVQPVTVVVHYVDERGEAIVPDSEALFQEGDHQVRPMADISSEDYTLTGPDFYPLTVSLEGASASEFTFTYQRVVKPVQVTVHYVNEAGEPITADTFQILTEGANVIFPQAMPDNYILREGAEPFQNVTVDADGAHPAEVTFVFQPLIAEPAEIPVRYIDQESGLEIASRSTVSANRDSVTEVSALPAPEDLLPDYLLVSEPVVSVSVNKDGVSSVEEVVFSYLYTPPETAAPEPVSTEEPAEAPTEAPTMEPEETLELLPTLEPTAEPVQELPQELPQPQPVTVFVHYTDTEGNPIAQDGQVYCNVGESVVSASPVDLPEGYVPDGLQDVLVHVDENGADPAEVTFTYRYVSESPAPKVALVNVKYYDPSGNVFNSYPATCVEGQENQIAVNWEAVDTALGYELNSPDIVIVTVDETGNATPAEVEFRFTNEKNAFVSVYYRDQVTGQDVAAPQEKVCYKGMNTIDADPFGLREGYVLSSPGSVSVTMNQDGTLTPAEVVFFYWREVTQAPEPTSAPYEEPMDVYFYPTGPSVRVRSAASTTENNTLGMVNSSDLGHIRGKITTEDGKVWYSVEINGLVGYMSDTVVRFLNEAEIMALFNYTPGPTLEPTPIPTEVPIGSAIDRWGQTNAKVNFRRTPEKSGTRITELHKNDRVWIYSSEDSKGDKWYAVNYKGTDGYVMAQYVDLLGEAESEQIQRSLASPVPTQIPPATPIPTVAPSPIPTLPPTQVPTEVPTPEPTEAPTPVPVTAAPIETPLPTETPVPYRGYALTTNQAALRVNVSMTDDAILQTLPAQTLLDVKAETMVDGVSWAHAQVVGSENVGYIPMSSLKTISNDEAAFYRNQIFTTPEVTASPSPEQVTGYAMTLGDGVPMRNYPDTNGEIITLLPYTSVAYVFSQQYSDAAWHLVQYNGMWGFIRQDQLRMMSPEEVAAYEESMIGGTPTPSPAPTPEPISQTSLSSYGYALANSGKVNLRSGPSVTSTALRMLDNYVFALVLGTETNDEGTWYHVSQAGTEGYIRSDYFYVLPLNELNRFLQSDEYVNANSEAPGNTTKDQILPVEDYNRNVWQNPALTTSYEPFNPFVTATPAPETTAPTNTPAPTDTPAPSATPQIAPVGPTDGSLPEPNVKQGGAPWPWILLGLAVVGGGGAYYAYTVHSQEKKRAAIRAQQARQARSQAAAHPQMHAAQNNPAQASQPVSRPSQPVNRTAQPMPQQPANRSQQPANQQNSAYMPPRQISPNASQPSAGIRAQTPAAQQPAVSGNTKTFSTKQTKSPTQVFSTRSIGAAGAASADGKAAMNPQPQNSVKPNPVQERAKAIPAESAAPEKPSEQAAADQAAHQRIRRTERHKEMYKDDSQA